MDEVIFRFFHGALSAREREALKAWRAAAPANEERFADTVRVLEASRDTEADRRKSIPTATLQVLDRVMPARSAYKAPARFTSRLPAMGRWLARAAAVVLLVTGGWVAHRFTEPAPREIGNLVTASDETTTFRLADGTVIRLAPSSRLRITTGRREVWLDGRAYLAVAHDDRWPFIVRTRAGDAVVLGTRFEIDSRDYDMRVVVVEGRVAMTSGQDTITVRAGEMSRLIGGNPSPVVKVSDVSELIDWTGVLLAFQATPLSEVLDEIRRAYHVRITLRDSTLLGETVTAWFQNQGLDEVMKVVCGVLTADCLLRPGEAIIGRGN
jgi:ferric-dicitrate binding protein FerR (iron transport regulator)